MQKIHDKVDFKLSYIGKYVNPTLPYPWHLTIMSITNI